MFAGPQQAEVYIVFDYPYSGGNRNAFDSPTCVEAFKLLLANGINPSHCRMAYAYSDFPKARLMSDNVVTLVKDVQQAGIIFHKKLGIPAYLCKDLAAVRADIEMHPRKLLLCFGMLAAQCIKSDHRIDSQHKWRGSMLDDAHALRAMPLLSPADWLIDYAKRFLVQHDIRRALSGFGRKWDRLSYQFSVAEPTLTSVRALLAPAELADKISVDIETANGIITSIAIAWNKTDAVCIPFVKGEADWYFDDPNEEAKVVHYLAWLLKRVPGIGQNYNYDRQYFAKQWGIAPPCIHDTMGAQHVLLNSSLPKDLATLASLHCQDYIFWKDESKSRIVGAGDDYSQWIYNCKDAAYTYEIAESQTKALITSGLYVPFMAWQRSFENAYRTMLKGTRYARSLAYELTCNAERILAKYDEVLNTIVPPDVHEHSGTGAWYNSSKTLTSLFYEKFGQPVVLGKTKTPSADEAAMEKIVAREPLLGPLVHTILDSRRIEKNVNTYLRARCDADGRMRTMYQAAGPITYRLASQKTAFDTGMNLQNLSKGQKHENKKHNIFRLPHDIDSVKQLFVPDPDYYIIDVDLEQADARVVAWDTKSPYLMGVFKDPKADLHTENAKLIFNDPTIHKKHPMRQRAKAGVHAVNYRVMAPTLAKTLGISVGEAQHFIDTWLAKNPEIKEWHNRLEWDVRKKGYVENVFGYRRYFLDREGPTTMSEAASWNPQSTVAIYINLVWDRIVSLSQCFGPQIDVLLQVHDSLVLQCRRVDLRPALQLIKTAFDETVCPYSHDPLVIAAGRPEISLKSWDDIKTVNWDLSPVE